MKAPMNSSSRPPLRLFGGRIPSRLQLPADARPRHGPSWQRPPPSVPQKREQGLPDGRGRRTEPTNEVYCFLKVGADVGCVVVFHGDPFVVYVGGAGLGKPPGDVQQGRDVQVGQELALGRMVGTSKVEEREDFNGAALEGGAEDTQEIVD